MEDDLAGWRLASELSVVDCAILLTGNSPSVTDTESNGLNDYALVKRTSGHPGFDGYFEALKAAIRSGQLPARFKYPAQVGPGFAHKAVRDVVVVEHGGIAQARRDDFLLPLGDSFSDAWADKLVIEREPDWERATIDVEALKAWLRARGVRGGFFFTSDTAPTEDFMDSANDSFSAELALAVTVWRAVSKKDIRSKSPKEVIEEWIVRHPEAWIGDGALSNSAIERIATLVNWRKKGGAPTTGGQ
jgi:hypothetical protein